MVLLRICTSAIKKQIGVFIDNFKFTLFCLDGTDQNDMIRKEFYIAE